MFGVGLSEILIIVLAFIVFVRPEEMPNFARKAARLFAEVKKMYREAVSVKDQLLKDLETSDTEPRNKPETQIPSGTGVETSNDLDNPVSNTDSGATIDEQRSEAPPELEFPDDPQ